MMNNQKRATADLFIILHSSFYIYRRYTYRIMTGENILILTAVRMECRVLQRSLATTPCRIKAVGIGAKYLASLDISRISRVLMCGVAGGLDPKLAIGDVVIDLPDTPETPVLRYPQEPGPVRKTNPALRGTSEPASHGFQIVHGEIHTADKMISTPEQKAELFLETGAFAVDMEQFIVRAFFELRGIPVIGIRAISDRADQTLDARVLGFVNDLGDPQPGKIMLGIARQPTLIPYLIELNRNTKLALANLGVAVRQVVNQSLQIIERV